MNTRWEIWGVVGVIAAQSVIIWLVYYIAIEITRIYLLKVPAMIP